MKQVFNLSRNYSTNEAGGYKKSGSNMFRPTLVATSFSARFVGHVALPRGLTGT